MPVPDEYSKRRSADELLCVTPALLKDVKPRPLHELAADIGAERAAAAREKLSELTPTERRQQLRQNWAKLLGDVEPFKTPTVLVHREQNRGERHGGSRIALDAGGVEGALLLLTVPPHQPETRPPVVLAVAQGGKAGFFEIPLRSDRRNPQGRVGGMSGGRCACTGGARRGRPTTHGVSAAPAPNCRKRSGCWAKPRRLLVAQ